jgi:hypothetical protein
MKLALTLVITAVFVPCMQAFDRGSQQGNDVLGKWLKQHMAKSQSSYETVWYYFA